MKKISLEGDIHFKIRFNTAHGDTDMYWRIIIDDVEYLANSVRCKVETFSDASYDKKAGAIKYHIAGQCKLFYVDDKEQAMFQ